MRLSLVHWLIAAAVLANAVVFFWPQEPAPAPGLTGVGSLRELKLLSELDSESPAREATPAAPPPPPPRPEAELEAEPEAEEKAEEEARADAGPAPEALAETEPGESEEAAAAPVTSSSAEQAVASEPDVEPEIVRPSASGPLRCWIAGPVDSDALSESLAARFAGAGIGLDLVLQTVEIAPDNWVYLLTSGSQSDVRRLSRELRQDGFENFQITDGPLAGSLSMGLFRSEERAQALRDRLRQLGHNAGIYARPAFREQPWAAIDDQDREALGWPAEPGPLPGFEALELRERECPTDG